MLSQILSRSSAKATAASTTALPSSNATTAPPSASPAPPVDATSVVSDPGPSRADDAQTDDKPTAGGRKRLSWLTIVYTSIAIVRVPKATLSPVDEQNVTDGTAAPKAKKSAPPATRTRSEKRAMKSALLVRDLIVGPPEDAVANPKARSGAAYTSLKAGLVNPKSANKIIAQLRTLPSSDSPVEVPAGGPGETKSTLSKGPIHAVCLQYTDTEVHERHFSRPGATPSDGQEASPAGVRTSAASERSVSVQVAREVINVTTASVAEVRTIFDELHVVSLITTPDLGIGQPADGPGLLSGALPTAKTVIEGIEQITPQLMALGYATGKAILPDHAGVYPPTDRMSVLTYWWGFELVLPEPSLGYLDNVPSVSHAIINFLTALSMVDGGVREILPFVRYISQYIDSEYNLIKGEDEGRGVVCAATWLMPAALVPRAWDFPQPPVAAPQAPAPDATDTSDPAPSPAESVPAAAPSLPSSNTSPMLVMPSVATAKSEPSSADGPAVKVTPPTPPVSQVLVFEANGGTPAQTG